MLTKNGYDVGYKPLFHVWNSALESHHYEAKSTKTKFQRSVESFLDLIHEKELLLAGKWLEQKMFEEFGFSIFLHIKLMYGYLKLRNHDNVERMFELAVRRHRITYALCKVYALSCASNGEEDGIFYCKSLAIQRSYSLDELQTVIDHGAALRKYRDRQQQLSYRSSNLCMKPFGTVYDYLKDMIFSNESSSVIRPNDQINNFLLLSCLLEKEFSILDELYSQIKSPSISNTTIYMQSLAEQRKIDLLREKFAQIPDCEKTPELCSVMLEGYIKINDISNSLQLLEEESCLTHSIRGHHQVISLLLQSDNISTAFDLLNRMKERKLRIHIQLMNRFLAYYLRNKLFSHAEIMFRELGCTPNLETYSIMLSVLSQRGNRIPDILELYETVKNKNIEIDDFFRTTMAIAFLKCEEKSDYMQKVLNEILATSQDPYRLHLKVLLQRREYESVHNLLKEMPSVDSDCFDLVFKTLAHFKETQTQIKFLQLMKERNLQPTHLTYSSLLLPLAKDKNISEISNLLDQMAKGGLKPNLLIYNSLIRGFLYSGDYESVKKVHMAIVSRNIKIDIPTYNCILYAASKYGTSDEFHDLLSKIDDRKIDRSTFNIIISFYVERKDSEAMKNALTQMRQRGFGPNVITLSLLIRNSLYQNNLLEAEKLLSGMKNIATPSQSIYSLFYNYLCFNSSSLSDKYIARAESIWDEAKQLGPLPISMWNMKITTLIKFGDLEAANQVVSEMLKSGALYDESTIEVLKGLHEQILEKQNILENA